MKFCPTCASKLEMVDREKALKTLQCSNKNCKYQFYNNPTPVVGAIIEHEENGSKKVLTVRGKGWPKDWFGLVTGFLEYSEDPKEAIIREINEELGIDLKNIKNHGLVGIYPFKRMNQIIMVYHCEIKGSININKDELEEYKLQNENEVVPWPFGTGPAIKEWLQKRKSKL